MTPQNAERNARAEARRGDQCLDESRYLLAGGFYNASVSRAYYAAFH